MPWVKVDDHFDEHPKHAKAGPLGWALWLAGLAYCNRNLTDGFIPWAVARGLVNWEFLGPLDGEGRQPIWTIGVTSGHAGNDVTCELVIELLVRSGLWEQLDETGYHVHDYPDYQPLKREILKQRKQTAQRVSAFRGKRRNAIRNAKSNTIVTPPPVPVPDPVPQEELEKDSTSLVGPGAPTNHLPTPDQVKEAFNRICVPPLSPVRWLNDSRKQHIRARLKSLDEPMKWETLFTRVSRNPFLCGENDKGWRASFDWLIANDARWTRIMEGQYDRKG